MLRATDTSIQIVVSWLRLSCNQSRDHPCKLWRQAAGAIATDHEIGGGERDATAKRFPSTTRHASAPSPLRRRRVHRMTPVERQRRLAEREAVEVAGHCALQPFELLL